MNNRRKLIIAIGTSAVASAFGSFAQQQGKVWRIGYLSQRHLNLVDSDPYNGQFRQGLREHGYIEGNNLIIEWRSAEGNTDRLPALAAELVRLNVDAIVTPGTPATLAAQHATATIPIVFCAVSDPVATGLVSSLARPGGHITGLANLASELGAKQLEMLKSMVPKLSRVATLVNPKNSVHSAQRQYLQSAAKESGLEILFVGAGTPQELESAFVEIAQKRAGALIVAADAMFNQQIGQIVTLAAKHRLPSISAVSEYTDGGGLMSYGSNRSAMYRRAATYVDKILKGVKPADLPVEQPTTFELVINRKAAKALGLNIPQALITVADKIIE